MGNEEADLTIKKQHLYKYFSYLASKLWKYVSLWHVVSFIANVFVHVYVQSMMLVIAIFHQLPTHMRTHNCYIQTSNS